MGCTPSVKVPNIVGNSAEILNVLDYDYKVLANEPCCGEPLICLGLFNESREIANNVVERIKNADVKEVIAPCSGCYNAFTKLYPEYLDVEFSDVEFLHFSQFLNRNMKGIQLKEPMKITYHDPCTLGRHAGVYDDPRVVLKSIQGIELVELERNREFASCCGGGGGLPSIKPNMALEIASLKLEKEVIPLEVDALVTSCPMCYMNFKYALIKKKIPLKIYDISEIVLMGLKKNDL
jgi:Fe-S oxidoreductase